MGNRAKIVLAGGSGYLGRVLARHLLDQGHEVVILTRTPAPGPTAAREIFWDGRALGAWQDELEGTLAVVNLAGRSVNCRYHQRNRDLIYQSRLASTEVLGKAISACHLPPRVWLNSSTATIYRHALDRTMDEESGEIREDAGKPFEEKWAFSVDVARRWEAAFGEASVPEGTRKVALRTAMVFGDSPGGVYEVLARLVRLGLGGTMGSGEQFVSFLTEEDFCRAVCFLIGREDLGGAFNLAAPEPLPNREMMRLLRRHLGRPFGLPATSWMLELGALFLRTETELLLKSRRVVPGRLAAAGFEFRSPSFEEALGSLG